jgi:hypothetical protein
MKKYIKPEMCVICVSFADVITLSVNSLGIDDDYTVRSANDLTF